MPDIANKIEGLRGDSDNDRPLRVFISYSHEDKSLVKIVAEVLESNGMTAVYDEKGLPIGSGFREEIIHYISHAQIFLPLLTETSLQRRWVQQEIGFAVALRVPTVPIAINCEPGEFLYGIQAIQLKTLDKEDLEKRLTRRALETCLRKYPRGGAPFQCADTTEERAMLFDEYARAVTNMGDSGMVRQLGGLSSFHIPVEVTDDPLWRLRYGDRPKTEHHCKVLREERLALTEHARNKGCRIVIDPDLDFSYYGGYSRRTRLECLVRFLRDKKIQPCEVAIYGLAINESMTIVGDWFAAHSISNKVGDGYRHTIFTRHAPTIARMIEDFDQRFDQCLKELEVPAAESRDYAIAEIDRRIKELPAPPVRVVGDRR